MEVYADEHLDVEDALLAIDKIAEGNSLGGGMEYVRFLHRKHFDARPQQIGSRAWLSETIPTAAVHRSFSGSVLTMGTTQYM